MLRAVLALRLRERKIQNPSEGPETVGFFGFPRFVLFSNRNPKKHMVFFGFPTEIPKSTGFFSPETEQENQKNPVFFGFPPKIKKSM